MNQVAVLFHEMTFPIYYNQFNYVIVTYKSNDPNPFVLLTENSQLNIFCLEVPKSKEDQKNNIGSDIKKQIYFKIIDKEPNQELELFDSYLYINEELANKLKIDENQPYISAPAYKVWKKMDKSYKSFVNEMQKIKSHQNQSKKFHEKPKFQIVFFKKLPTIQHINQDKDYINSLQISKWFRVSRRLKKRDMLDINLTEKLEDFSKIRIIDMNHQILFIRLRIIVNVYNSNNLEDFKITEEIIKLKLINNIISSQNSPILYDKQLILIEKLICIIKILENNADSKINVIDILKINLKIPKDQEQIKDIKTKLSDMIIINFSHFHDKLVSEKRLEYYISKINKSNDKLRTINKSDQIFFTSEFNQIMNITSLWLHDKTPFCHLIYGPKLGGKTSMALRIKNQLKNCINYQFIDFNQFLNFDKNSGNISLAMIKAYLNLKFNIASIKQPTLLILDNIDSLCKNISRIDSLNSNEILISECLSALIKDNYKNMKNSNGNISIIFISEGRDHLNDQLLKIINDSTQLKKLNYEERKNYIKSILEHLSKEDSEEIINQEISLTENMNIAALKAIKDNFDNQIQLLETQKKNNPKLNSKMIHDLLIEKASKNSKLHG